MAGLAILRWFNVPAFLQRLADLNLGQMFLFRPVFSYALRLPVFRNEIGRIHVLRLPIEIGNLILRAKEILRMAVTLKAPRHAHRFRIINHGHVVDLAVAAGATDSAIHMRGVIIEDVIGQPVDPYPVDWSPVFPTLADRLEFRVVLLHLGVAVHAKLRVRNVRMRRDFNEAVAVTAIHSELADVDIVRERNWLDRLVADLGVFGGYVIPRGSGETADNQKAGYRHLKRQPVAPAWKKIRHRSADALTAQIQPTL